MGFDIQIDHREKYSRIEHAMEYYTAQNDNVEVK